MKRLLDIQKYTKLKTRNAVMMIFTCKLQTSIFTDHSHMLIETMTDRLQDHTAAVVHQLLIRLHLWQYFVPHEFIHTRVKVNAVFLDDRAPGSAKPHMANMWLHEFHPNTCFKLPGFVSTETSSISCFTIIIPYLLYYVWILFFFFTFEVLLANSSVQATVQWQWIKFKSGINDLASCVKLTVTV